MKVQVGDEVKVSFRGKVLKVESSGPIDDGNGHFGEVFQYLIRGPYDQIFITDDHIEKIYKNYEVGAVYRTQDGELFKRNAWGEWLSFGDNEHYTDDQLGDLKFTKVLDGTGFPV